MCCKRLNFILAIGAIFCSVSIAKAAPVSECQVIEEALQTEGLEDGARNALLAATTLCQGQEPPTKDKCKLAPEGVGTGGTQSATLVEGPACDPYNKCGNFSTGGPIPCIGMEMYCKKCKIKHPNGGCIQWDNKKSLVAKSCGCYTDDGLKGFCGKSGKDESGKQKECTVSYYDEDGKNDKDCKDFNVK